MPKSQYEKRLHVSLRLTPELHASLQALAASEHRSMHGQITYLLERHFSEQDRLDSRIRTTTWFDPDVYSERQSNG